VDQRKYDYLWKEYDKYYKFIFFEVSNSHKAKQTFDIYKRFDRTEKKLLDALIIECFPDTYIKYLEEMAKTSQDSDDQKKKTLLL
jgi:hypothetical protein